MSREHGLKLCIRGFEFPKGSVISCPSTPFTLKNKRSQQPCSQKVHTMGGTTGDAGFGASSKASSCWLKVCMFRGINAERFVGLWISSIQKIFFKYTWTFGVHLAMYGSAECSDVAHSQKKASGFAAWSSSSSSSSSSP